MRDRNGWLHTTMIELAAAGNGESVYVSDFTGRLAKVLTPAELRVLADLAGHALARERELEAELRQSQELARQLQHALDSRIIIEQAKGAVAASLGITPRRAFDLLRTYARAHSQSLPQLAGTVVGGTVPVTALLPNDTVPEGTVPDGLAPDGLAPGGRTRVVRPALPLPSAAPRRRRCRPAACRSPRR